MGAITHPTRSQLRVSANPRRFRGVLPASVLQRGDVAVDAWESNHHATREPPEDWARFEAKGPSAEAELRARFAPNGADGQRGTRLVVWLVLATAGVWFVGSCAVAPSHSPDPPPEHLGHQLIAGPP